MKSIGIQRILIFETGTEYLSWFVMRSAVLPNNEKQAS